MLSTGLLVLINLTLSATLTGLIWTIQLVHYPGFLGVGADGFSDYQQNHMRTISYLVVPLMLAELTMALLLQFYYRSLPAWGIYLATALVLFIWAITFFISSPLHGKLASQGYDSGLIRQLVTTNWLRTVAWTTRTGVLFFLTLQLIKK